ncbi:MAG: hypothetical protein GF364_22405 [Candidatus Lokiarchaeota archaeon]|nr:hypothetical protein [Candidatus Lokiarchaeota archaeon]
MFDKRKRLFILNGLILFLMVGMGLNQLGQNKVLMSDYSGEDPNDLSQTPDSSFNQDYTGSDGSNVGVYGYTNGTKQGSYDIDDWYGEAPGRDISDEYTRSNNIPYPLPDEAQAPWHVKDIDVDISDLYAIENLVEDPHFQESNVWDTTTIPEEGNRQAHELSMTTPYGGYDNSLITGSLGPYTTQGNEYFYYKRGMIFDLSPNNYYISDSFQNGAPTGFTKDVYTNTVDRTQDHGSIAKYGQEHNFWVGWLSPQMKDLQEMETTCFGYQTSGTHWSECNHFTHDGSPASPTTPPWGNYAPYIDWTPSVTRNGVTGDVKISGALNSFCSAGYYMPGESDWKGQARVSAFWENDADYDFYIPKQILWKQDQSLPEVSVSFDVSMNSILSEYDWAWIQSQCTQNDAWHDGSALITVTPELWNPYGVKETSQSPIKFGFGGSYESDPSVIKDGTPQSVDWDLTEELYYTTNPNNWQFKIHVQIDMENHGNTGTVNGPYGGEGDSSEVSVELEIENYIEVNIEDFELTIKEDTQWDEDFSSSNDPKQVYYIHNQIDFGNREVSEDINPKFEFDWYIPDGIVGPNYPEGDPDTEGLDFAEPFARVIYDKGLPSEGTHTFYDSRKTFEDIRGTPVITWMAQYPWLCEPGHEYDHGGYHFESEWTGGANLLDGVNTIDFEVGFEFKEDFNVDYYMNTANSSLFITNVTFLLKTAPYANEVDMELVWDQDGTGTSGNYEVADIQSNLPGTGYLDTWSALDDYHKYGDYPGRMFYFRSLSESMTFTWSITLILEYDYWDYTTSYTVSADGGNAEYSVDIDMPVPKSGLTIDYKDNFWFDVIFPRYTMIENGEPYWDLVQAYETSHYSTTFAGQEDLTQALGALDSQVMVCENQTDAYGLGDQYYDSEYMGADLAKYHQFGRFHHDLFTSWVYSDDFTWHVTFEAKNYVDEIILDEDDTFDEDQDLFREGHWVKFKGIFANPIDDYNDLTDMGTLSVGWYDSGSTDLLPGANQNPRSAIVNKSDTQFNVTNDYYIGSAVIPPDSGYWVGFSYQAEDCCGLSVPGDYCSGIFRLGFMAHNFSMIRDAYVDGGVNIPLPLKADNVPYYDTLVSDELIPIKITYRDQTNDAALTGATAKINVTTYYMEAAQGNKKLMKYEEGWEDLELIDLNNGSYICYVDPNTKTHTGNMTQGFHNFTLIVSKPGYISVELHANFSIIVDTVLTIETPEHTALEDSQYNPTSFGRPHYDSSTYFAGNLYSFKCNVKENSTTANYLLNDTSQGTPFYGNHMRISYNLLGFRTHTNPETFYDYLTEGFIGWDTWFTGDEENTMVNGSMEQGVGNFFLGNFTWPEFEGNEALTYYQPYIHVYYNVTVEVLTDRESYSPDPDWQPNDVEFSYCEDNPTDSSGQPNTEKRNYYEEIFGLTLHREGTGNQTRLSLINNKTDNAFAFENGEFNQDPTGNHENDDFVIQNYWYNVTGEKFRLRVRFNCTQTGTGSTFAPPVGPLNKSGVMYGVDYSGWMGETKIKLTGWNDSSILFDNDDTYLWHTIVNETATPPWKDIDAWGETYVSPWLYFNEIDTTTDEENGVKWLTITAEKTGFIRDQIDIKLNLTDQLTKVYNETELIEYSVVNPIVISTPTGIKTSFVIRYNDTMNDDFGINVGIEDAIISCIDDDWSEHFENGYGTTWTYQELENGKYNITLIDTYHQVFDAPVNKEIIFQINKGNYSAVEFKIELEITARDLAIVYVGGKDVGLYTPEYLEGQYVMLAHINLTYQLLDVTNDSEPVDFSEDVIADSFDFYKANGVTKYETDVTKHINSSGVYYYVVINSHLDIDGSNHYAQDYLVNFTTTGITDYYNTYTEHTITIEAVDTAITNRTDDEITLQYLWPEYTQWIEGCPTIEYNLTDVSHSAYWSLPIEVNDITSLYSTYDNPYIPSDEAINKDGAAYGNEDIFLRTKFDSSGGSSYEYLEIIIDTRGMPIQDELQVDIELRKMNYINVTLQVTINILNASAQIQDGKVLLSIIDNIMPGQQPNWQTGELISWDYYTNPNGNNEKEVPWNMIFAVKFTYMSGSMILSSDLGGVGDAQLNLRGLQTELIGHTEEYNSEFYYYFRANISNSEAVNNNISVDVWKPNFDPVSYEINYTIRERKTEFLNKNPFSIEAIWTENATFKFEYFDLDYGENHRNDTVEDPAINNTLMLDLNGPMYIFGAGINATWVFDKSTSVDGEGYYTITILTSNLIANSTPYEFNFNITKLGDDGNPHWEVQEFTVYLTVNPVELNVEHWFEYWGTESDFSAVGWKDGGFAIVVDLEYYENFTLYVRISYEVNDDVFYLTEGDDFVLNVSIWDWSGAHKEEYLEDNLELVLDFEWVPMPEEEFGGVWKVVVPLGLIDDEDGDDPIDIQGYVAILTNVTVQDPNIASKLTEWQILAKPAWIYIPWYFWVLLSVFGAGAAIVVTYGVRRALRLRIPFVLRMIDESINKISDDKFPTVGVMRNRNQYIVDLVVSYLEDVGIEWETTEKYSMEEITRDDEMDGLPPLTDEELQAELEKITSLSMDERMLFLGELKELSRKSQIDFLKSLEED